MKRMILVDGNSLMYRAYYGTAYTGNLMQNKKGLYTNAIYSFINMINHLTNSKYDYMLVAFDAGKKTFRHEKYDAYKGGRTPMPEELRVQIPYIKKYLDLANICRYELELYEADDIIGTMAKMAETENCHVDIYSSDRDLLQLVDENITVHMTKKGMTDLESYTPEYFKQKYQIEPNQMVDLKGLMGDSSDNLKGISGVGEKTAVKLLCEYKTVESIVANRNLIKGKLGEKIQNDYQNALDCKQLAMLNLESPIMIILTDTTYKEKDVQALNDFYLDLEFHSFLKKKRLNEVNSDFKLIDDYTSAFISKSAIQIEVFGENYHNAPIIGMAVCNENGNFYIPKNDLLKKEVKAFLEDKTKEKYTFDCKKAKVALKYVDIDLQGVTFDLLIASYLLNPKNTKEDFKVVVSNFDYQDVAYDEEVYGKGAKFTIPEENIYQGHIVNKARAIKALIDPLCGQLKEQEMLDLFKTIEMPLAFVLGEMEYNGIKVSIEELKLQKAEMGRKILEMEDSIYDLVGQEFNISSPKQLGEILFEKLKLPIVKKTKTGYSTDQEVLEELSHHNLLPKMILEYRSLTKLYSTYIEGIRNVLFEDGKVHTIFKQTLTETGRLSSIEPNLQNIPIRTPEGALIRKMFIPENDYLMSLDYSQIELRVLAHVANVDNLIDTFKHDRDVHEETAKAIFKKETVSKEDRRAAKAVNFGIIYGISSWGLAKEVGIGVKEADKFISEYLSNYPQIKEYMDKTIDFAKEKGYVKTIMNRRRYIPEITSAIYAQREFGKRVAMNAPIQGSAADIIKKAMVEIECKMKERNLKSKLIIQVHDELIFDCLKEEIEIMQKLVKETMENIVNLKVPLIVQEGHGKNWYEAK